MRFNNQTTVFTILLNYFTKLFVPSVFMVGLFVFCLARYIL